MVDTQFVQTQDGTRIAYDVTECATSETAPSLLLVHGYSDDRQLNWHAFGWAEKLSQDFRVITVDLRGCGESDAYSDVDRYRLDDYLSDLLAVMDAVGAENYLFWGWSFGATLGLHLAAHPAERLSRVVISGTPFGAVFTQEMVNPVINVWEQLITIKETGDYEKIAPEERDYLRQVNAQAMLTRWEATLVHHYMGVEPDAIKIPALVVTGTKDDYVVGELEPYRDAMAEAGIKFHVFDEMDHHGLISDVETVSPVIRAFLLGE
ncbi:MAG: alpha/beta hydrolase [Aggregatilineales bacterium]